MELTVWERQQTGLQRAEGNVTAVLKLTAPVGMGANTEHPDLGILRMCVGCAVGLWVRHPIRLSWIPISEYALLFLPFP